MAVKQSIMIPEIKIGQFTLRLVGDSPLIVHRWSEKAKREILDKQMKVAKTRRHDIRDPVADFMDSLYWLTPEPEEKNEAGFERALKAGARFGFPATAFKASAVSRGIGRG